MGGEFTSNHYTTSPQTRYDEGLSDLFKTVNKRDYPGRQKKKKKTLRALNIKKTWLDKEVPLNLKVPLTDILQVLDCL